MGSTGNIPVVNGLIEGGGMIQHFILTQREKQEVFRENIQTVTSVMHIE
jgi:hypothetical protein